MATRRVKDGRVTGKQVDLSGRWRVAPGTQVHHDGRTYSAGELLPAGTVPVTEWVARHYVKAA